MLSQLLTQNKFNRKRGPYRKTILTKDERMIKDAISKAKRKEEKEKRSREEEAVEAFLQILPPLAVSPLVGGSNSL